MNLQFFGGRGSYSGLDTIKQITVNIDGNNITYRNEKEKKERKQVSS